MEYYAFIDDFLIAALRAPPRAISAYALYTKRMYPNLIPRPTSITVGVAEISGMWRSLTDKEKQVRQYSLLPLLPD